MLRLDGARTVLAVGSERTAPAQQVRKDPAVSAASANRVPALRVNRYSSRRGPRVYAQFAMQVCPLRKWLMHSSGEGRAELRHSLLK